MREDSFFSRILGRGVDDDEFGTHHPAEEFGTRRSRRGVSPEQQQRPRGFTVEVAAEMIDDLPSDVPRESALRIVRGTLAAAGIEFSDLEKSIRARPSKLSSEIELARNRQKKLREDAEKIVYSLEEEIRKHREVCDTLLEEEQKKISHASAALRKVERVRAFFDFPKAEEEEDSGSADRDAQGLGSLDAVGAQEGRHAPWFYYRGPTEDPSTYRAPQGPSEEQ
jgi:hypothetical protein